MLSHRRSFQGLVTLLVMLGLLAGFVSPAVASTWTIAKISDFSAYANFFPDVVASPNGNFYAAYKYSDNTLGTEELKVLKWNGTSWTTLHTITPSAPGINLNTFGDWVWLAVQSESNIHLAFSGYKGSGTTSERGVHYGHYNGSAWTFDTVDVYTDPNGWKNVQYFNMAVDSANRPHLSISVSDANGSRASTLIYAVKNASWTKSTVLSYTGGSELINYPAIAVDPAGKAHIAYEDASSTPNKLYVSTNATGTWTRSEIATELTGASLALYDLRADSAGKLHATYIQNAGETTSYYATNESGTWQAAPVPGSTGEEDVPRLSFSANGGRLITYVSYKNAGTLTNMVAVKKPGGSWVVEPASNAGDISYFVSSAIDNKNQVMIVDQREKSLWYATATIPLTEITSVLVPANATYVAGQNLDFTVNFNEPVTVATGGGSPHIPVTLSIGGTVQANYLSGSGTSALVFRYTVAAGNQDTDGITLGTNITLNGGTIKNSQGTDATLALKGVGSTTGVLIDAIPPAAPVFAYPENGSTFNDNTPTYRGNAEPSSTVKVYVDGSLSGTVTAGGTGFWVFTPTLAITDGSHTVHATAADAVGNTGSASTAITFTIDTAPPAVPVLVLPANGSISSNNVPTFSGTAEPSILVNIYLDTVHRGSAVASAEGNWSWRMLEYIPDGTHTVWVTASDPVGNESAASVTHTFIIDTTPPQPPVITSPANGAIIRDNTPTITGTAEAGSTVRIYLENGTLLGAPVADAAGNWSLTPVETILDGLHSIGGRATDPYGNESSPAVIVLFTVDTVAPAAPIVTTPWDGSLTYDSTPTITGTAEAGSTVAVSVDGSAVGTAQADATGTWSLTLSVPLSDGSHTVHAAATDAAGNTGTASVANNFTVDSTAPTVTLTTTALNPTKNEIIVVKVTFSEPIMVLVDKSFTVTNGTVTTLTGSEANYTLEVRASGQGLVSVNLPAGSVVDMAGNISQASNTLTITYDSIAPTLTSITRGDPSPTKANTVHYTVTFTEPLAALDAADFDLTTTGLTGAAVENVAGDSGVFVVTVSTGTGTGTLRLDLTSGALADLAGNALVATGSGWQNGVYTGGEVYNVDRTAPVAELLSAEKLPRSGSEGYTFTVRYSDEQGIDPAQFGNGNIRLTGTDFDQPVQYVSTAEVTTGKVYEVTYLIDAPSGGWGTIPYQTYSLVLQANQVKDTNGIYMDETVLGNLEKQMHIWVLPLILFW